MSSRQLNIVLAIIIVLLTGVIIVIGLQRINPASNYEECVYVGGIIQESYPSVCTHKGRSFVQPFTPPPADAGAQLPPETQSPSKSELQTYKNTKYNFQVQLPENWIAKEEGPVVFRALAFQKLLENNSKNCADKDAKTECMSESYGEQVSFSAELGDRDSATLTGTKTFNGVIFNKYVEGGLFGNYTTFATLNNGTYYAFTTNEKNVPYMEQILSTFKFTETSAQATYWKDTVYSQFKNLTSWKVATQTDWRLVSLEKSQLTKYGTGNILVLSKTFNEAGSPDYTGFETLAKAVQDTLKDNGWKLTASPTEGGFYYDFLYVKDGHPLIMQTGRRDAVKGGLYVNIQFLE